MYLKQRVQLGTLSPHRPMEGSARNPMTMTVMMATMTEILIWTTTTTMMMVTTTAAVVN